MTLIAGLLFLGAAGAARAQGIVQPFRSYAMDSAERPIPIPDPYLLDHIIEGNTIGIGPLDTPRDIFIDRENDHLYVADTLNDRIVELDAEGRLVRQLGPELGLKRPQGIFCSPHDGTLWIADTGTSRILQVTPEGEMLATFKAPKSDLLVGIETTAPSKVLVDKRGYIYFLEGTGAGMIVMDRKNQFRGFFGTTRLGFNLTWFWSRYVATQEQQEKIMLAKPTAHTDMFLNDDGFVYTAVAGENSQPIQKLSPVGVNVLVAKSLEQKLYKPKRFAERRRVTDAPPRFVSVTVDENGTVTAIDASTSRIYQYDQDRNLLMAFGRRGIGRVEFAAPSEVAVDSKGLLYVLDSSRAIVYVFRPTEFGELVHRASMLQFDGRYDEASEAWQESLKLASNYELARSGIAAAYYHENDWRQAMEAYRLGGDQLGYSLAFYEYRQDRLRRNMGWLVGGIFVAMAGVLAWPALTRRKLGLSKAVRGATTNQPNPVLGILARPIETFQTISEGRSFWPVAILVILAGLARVASLALIAFHMRATPAAGSLFDWIRLYRPVAATLLPELRWEESNLLVEMSRIILPWFLWTLANYGVSALFDGQGDFRAVARTTAYCLVPYILFAVPIALLSHLLTGQERGVYEALWSVLYYWILILLFLEIRTVHDYSTGRTVGVGLVGVFGMIVLIGLILLVVMLGREVANFLGEFGYEVIRKIIL